MSVGTTHRKTTGTTILQMGTILQPFQENFKVANIKLDKRVEFKHVPCSIFVTFEFLIPVKNETLVGNSYRYEPFRKSK